MHGNTEKNRIEVKGELEFTEATEALGSRTTASISSAARTLKTMDKLKHVPQLPVKLISRAPIGELVLIGDVAA